MNYKLVPMDKSHLPQVAQLDRECFTRPWSADIWESELYDLTVSLVVAEGDDGFVLGYGVLGVILDEGSLEKLAVRPEYRRQGVAQAILDSFLAYGRDRLSFITLEVRANNDPALQLYMKNGFTQVGRRKNYYPEDRQDAILMTLQFQ